MLERRLQAIADIAARRERLAAGFSARLGAVTRMRFALENAKSTGLGDGLTAIAAALEEARVLALTTGGAG
jgi:hypothetical protein